MVQLPNSMGSDRNNHWNHLDNTIQTLEVRDNEYGDKKRTTDYEISSSWKNNLATESYTN